ncbi:Inosine-uridine preferring nucleoside hydrolase [Symmachiella dynata]|uniref:Inosine-uridine preferring nucleoside hydrolase n=1 Tax=Symmachiella dynata TaxID=2527995 RepID=A0A517ZYP1_9PLAN|nr:nucleoside hydrolase [Symmachiella dynata]QDU47563.1 Inosine-uridine preferring nucleoside hydrolase [Symmachiella dynata]
MLLGSLHRLNCRRTLLLLIPCLVLPFMSQAATAKEPVKLIFDTDLGDDIDDAMALATIHALQSRGECELLAVTIVKDNELSGPAADAINTFYGRPDIPVGVVKKGVRPQESRFTGSLTNTKNGDKQRYPHTLLSGNDAPEATEVLRKTLVAQPDHSVVIAQVGYMTNLARLLNSPPDKISPLNGRDLVAKKVKLLSIMAGNFGPAKNKPEFNVVQDLASSKKLLTDWPTPVVISGYEIGLNIRYPWQSVEKDFGYVKHHPVHESYLAWDKKPHERPTWDLTSVLYAVRPDHGYFGLSDPGTSTVDDRKLTQFEFDPEGLHRYLTVTPEQIIRVREALVQLTSQPPDVLPEQ